jgi:prepilin-type N-terminal cleavage/methylation domain-containing protein/prepilin-type processing-associated H-X9-DG protein
MSQKAFTLIELLVVIGIVAILAALIFPVFSRAKVAAQKTENISNLRQLSVGMMLYAGDNDDWIPTWSEYAYDVTNGLPAPSWGIDTPSVMWDSKLVPYVKQGNSPVVQVDLVRPGVWHSPQSEESESFRSYGMNQMLVFEWIPTPSGGFDVSSNRWRYLSLSQADRQSETIAIGDGGREGRLAPPRNWDGWKDKYVDHLGYYRREAPWRYDGRAGYVMLDGHAKSILGNILYIGPTHDNSASTTFGENHCSTSKYFVPNEQESDWHKTIAQFFYQVECN